jgi:hypothetical protein
MEQQWSRVGFIKHTTSLVVFRNIKFWGHQGYTNSNGGIGVHPLIFSSHVVTHAIMKRYITSLPPNHLTATHGPRRDQTCRYLHRADPTVGRSRTARWPLIDETHVGLMQVQKGTGTSGSERRGGAVSIGGKNRGGGDPDGWLFPE